MIQVLKALVINPQLELVAVLHNVERVIAYFEGVLKGGAELLHLVDLHTVPVHLLLPAEVAAHELNRDQCRVEAQLPDETRFRPITSYLLMIGYFLRSSPMSRRSKFMGFISSDILFKL